MKKTEKTGLMNKMLDRGVDFEGRVPFCACIIFHQPQLPKRILEKRQMQSK